MNDPARGRIVWRELMTPDTEKSRAFYGELFGWKFDNSKYEALENYIMFSAGDAEIGGFVPCDEAQKLPSYWIGYVSVDDLDERTASVEGLGGKVVHGPTPIADVGRFSVVRDPEGGHIALFDPARPGQVPEQPKPWTFCWDEVATGDVARLEAFYTRAVGWTTSKPDFDDSGNYLIFKQGDAMAAGLSQGPAGQPAAWTTMVLVDDLDGRLDKAKQLGASVLVEPTPLPFGRFAVLRDPVGAVIGIFQQGEPPKG